MKKNEIIELLQSIGSEQKMLFRRARDIKEKEFGNYIILRGVIETTNLCKVNCDYCPMRKDNIKNNSIFTLEEKEILSTANIIKDNNVNIVFFQGGEVPQTTKLIGRVIPKIRKLFNDKVEILLNLGIKRKDEFQYLYDQGATSYILKHETSDEDLHFRLRHEHLSTRIEAIKNLVDIGFKTGTGMIVGLPGQSISSIANDIILAKDLGVHMCSASPFIPAPNTPLVSNKHGSVDISLNAISIMRILSPNWLIPSVSALEKIRKDGQAQGIRAGANVLTINFTPSIAKQKYLIYGRERFVVKNHYVSSLIKKERLLVSPSVFIKR
ncbi:biotin synthase [Salipaludibacillus neizhouensis]|uniref:Biotin synthase n=1 Tax=Salipaludibacillus neizhouensis TaxID=885475 RepID=A0A3A9JXG8_9BACI|nr:radical SAM protein [Salipaludibacillus neizhouensis]RKL64959.1 biotin synthase [Salipaludibacillus neizhouensis]